MRLLLVVLASITLSQCVSTMSSDVEINKDPDDDRSYISAYDKASRDHKINVNFETRFTITATYLSPEFRAAFAKRYQKLFDTPRPFLEEASSKAGFFVTVFSPEHDAYDLTDNQVWNLNLVVGDKKHAPILVKRLHNKKRWKPFFIDVHQWSFEYLVLFDTPSVSLDEKMVKQDKLTFQVANADAKIKFRW